MRTAYQHILEIYLANDNVLDLRTASFRLAIDKIARAYTEMGL